MGHKPALKERRQSTLRRQAMDLIVSQDGRVSEAKLFALAGKATCLWLILAFTEEVLKTEYTLLTLLAFVITPDLIKMFLRLKLSTPAK